MHSKILIPQTIKLVQQSQRTPILPDPLKKPQQPTFKINFSQLKNELRTNENAWISYKCSMHDIQNILQAPRNLFKSVLVYINENVKTSATCVDHILSVLDDMQTVGYRPTEEEFELIVDCYEMAGLLKDPFFLYESVKQWNLTKWSGEFQGEALKPFLESLMKRSTKHQNLHALKHSILFCVEYDQDYLLFKKMVGIIIDCLIDLKLDDYLIKVYSLASDINADIPLESYQRLVFYYEKTVFKKDLIECIESVQELLDCEPNQQERYSKDNVIHSYLTTNCDTTVPSTIQISFLCKLLYTFINNHYSNPQIFNSLLSTCLFQNQLMEADILWSFASRKKPNKLFIHQIFLSTQTTLIYMKILSLQQRTDEILHLYKSHLACISQKNRRNSQIHLVFIKFFLYLELDELANYVLKSADEVGIQFSRNELLLIIESQKRNDVQLNLNLDVVL
jgi:hypothetical protein